MFRSKNCKSKEENSRVDSGIQVSLVVIGQMVVSPAESEGSAGTHENLRAEGETDGVVELCGFEDWHLPVEMQESEAPVHERLDSFRAEVGLNANRCGSNTINRTTWIDQELPVDNELLRGLHFERDGNNFRRVFESNGAPGKQGAGVLQIQEKQLPVFRGPLEDERKWRVAGPGAKLVGAAAKRKRCGARRSGLSGAVGTRPGLRERRRKQGRKAKQQPANYLAWRRGDAMSRQAHET